MAPSSQSSSMQGSAEYNNRLDLLLSTFGENYEEEDIKAVFFFSGGNYEISSVCILKGITLSAIITMLRKRFDLLPRIKLQVDMDDVWADMVAFYKGRKVNFFSKLRIQLNDKPPIDTGGVRRQMFTTVFSDFAHNKSVHLFDGPCNYLRPTCSAEARSSGLFKALGSMVSHSICQDGIGFPYLSPTCYWYIIGGESKALQFANIQDLPADSAFLINKVIVWSHILSRYKRNYHCATAH